MVLAANAGDTGGHGDGVDLSAGRLLDFSENTDSGGRLTKLRVCGGTVDSASDGVDGSDDGHDSNRVDRHIMGQQLRAVFHKRRAITPIEGIVDGEQVCSRVRGVLTNASVEFFGFQNSCLQLRSVDGVEHDEWE